MAGYCRLHAMFAAALGVLILSGAARAQDYMPSQGYFREFAHELLTGINDSDLADIPAIGGYGKPRIAVLPFEATDGVPKVVTAEFNTRLLAELTRQGSRTYRFVARDTLKSIIREIDSIGELEPGADVRVADLLRNARVDILVVGRLRKVGNAVVLSYRAVSTEDGTLFAATEPRRLHGAPNRSPAPAIAQNHLPPSRIASKPPPPFRGDRPRFGRGRPMVAETQRLLYAHGYHPGAANGIMRPRTRMALRRFQRDVGLPVNGRMTRRVVRRLRFSQASR
ncbi:MAG: peptidoglycan-binding protein [Alphaproteobacteria bacterium]